MQTPLNFIMIILVTSRVTRDLPLRFKLLIRLLNVLLTLQFVMVEKNPVRPRLIFVVLGLKVRLRLLRW